MLSSKSVQGERMLAQEMLGKTRALHASGPFLLSPLS
jgi:hypothetical protein